jgi:acyl-CoA dehydrogenase
MDFGYSQKVLDLQTKLRDFMDGLILPNNERWHREVAEGTYPLDLIDDLKAEAKKADLWNLFLPGLRDDEPGTRLTNIEYAPLAEIMGRVPWSSEIFNCSAPDTGNIEILHMFATPQQRVAQSAPRSRDPLGNLDHRARCGILRSNESAHQHPPRWR